MLFIYPHSLFSHFTTLSVYWLQYYVYIICILTAVTFPLRPPRLAFAICGRRWQNEVHEIKYSVCDLLLRPESFSIFLSYLTFDNPSEVLITKALICTRKQYLKDSDRSSKMASSCKWPICVWLRHFHAAANFLWSLSDVNECEAALSEVSSQPNNPCSHKCENSPGSFRCSCKDGYQLKGNQCEGEEVW